MATCRICSNEVSENARSCPNRGTTGPINKPKRLSVLMGVIRFTVAIFVIAFLINLVQPATPAPARRGLPSGSTSAWRRGCGTGRDRG